jgi:hypothetical protein
MRVSASRHCFLSPSQGPQGLTSPQLCRIPILLQESGAYDAVKPVSVKPLDSVVQLARDRTHCGNQVRLVLYETAHSFITGYALY